MILLITLNLTSINSGSTKILCMIIKLKFTEPEAEVYIARISYIRHQYLVSLAFVMWAQKHLPALIIPVRLLSMST